MKKKKKNEQHTQNTDQPLRLNIQNMDSNGIHQYNYAWVSGNEIVSNKPQVDINNHSSAKNNQQEVFIYNQSGLNFPNI